MRVGLRLITQEDLADSKRIALLKRWREKNASAYYGTYTITTKSMKEWLLTHVLNDPDRFLFWIIVDKTYVGHIGIKNITRKSIEIDNLARGEAGFPGVMGKALQEIISLYWDKHIWLRVLPQNTQAIRFYKRHGFSASGIMGTYIRMDL